MQLTNRLQAVANFVPKDCRFGDVGTDHAYLPVYLIENGIVSSVIASDINQGPVENALDAVKEAGFESSIEVRLGGGLTPFSTNEVNVVSICGMGGILIRDILIESDRFARTLDKIIVQPMVSQSDLRQWLSINHYDIIEETIAREGSKFYEIFSIKSGVGRPLTDLELEIGINAIHSDKPDSIAFLDYKIRKFELIEEKIRSNGSEAASDILQKSIEMKNALKELKASVCKY